MNYPTLLELLSLLAMVGAAYYSITGAFKMLASLRKWGVTIPTKDAAFAAMLWLCHHYIPLLITN